jgi:excisionase family DNA binding protein
MASEPAEVMSIEELAKYLKISTSTLYKLAQEGGLPGQKVGRRWRFHKGAIDDWLRQHPEHIEDKQKRKE